MGLPFTNPRKPAKGPSGLTRLTEMLSTNVGASLGLGNALGMPIAIDFGTGALKMLQVQTGERPALLAAVSLETPQALINDGPRRMEFQLSALPKLVKKGGFKGKRAVCAVPAWQTTCKHLQFARQDGIPLAQLVEAAIPMQMGVEASSLVYRIVEVSNVERNDKKIDVVLLAVDRGVVNRLMQTLVEARLEPVGIQSEFMCTVRAFDDLHRREGDTRANTLYLDLGASSTKVMITHGRDLVFARMIDAGGHHLDTAIAKQLNIDEVTARGMRLAMNEQGERAAAPAPAAPARPSTAGAARTEERRSMAGVPGFSGEVLSEPASAAAPEGVDLSEALEIITDEVRLCMRYHASQFPGQKVERIIFVGGEARHRGLTQHLARVLRLPAQVADPMALVTRTGQEPVLGMNLSHAQPGWAVALGLCLAPTDL